MDNFNIIDIQNEIVKMNEEKQSINSIISKFLPFIENNILKRRELNILGKFINCMQSEQIEIIEFDREAPDFLIKYSNKLIGLEIIEAKNNNIKPKTTNELLEEASKFFVKKYPEINIVVTFTFKNYELSFNKTNKASYIQQICDATYSCYNGFQKYPEFIDAINISRISGKGVFFSQIWVGYVNELDENIIQNLINKKEKLLNAYKENSQTNSQWLLISTIKGFPNSFDIEYVIEMSFSSKFDRVYLFEEVTPEVKRLV